MGRLAVAALLSVGLAGCGTLGNVDRALGGLVNSSVKAVDKALKKANKVDESKRQAEAHRRSFESWQRSQKQNFNKTTSRPATSKTKRRQRRTRVYH